MKILVTISLAFFILGCQSETDKCVNAIVADNPHIKEGGARLLCLEAQNKSQ